VWVGVEVDLSPAAIRDVGVALRGAEIRVPEHLLHGPKIGAAFEQMRGEGVTQEVGVDTLRLETRLGRELAEDEEGAGSRERAATCVQEELWTAPPVEVRAAECEVSSNRLSRRAAERDEALLVALAEDSDDSLVDVDAAPLETDGLRDAETRAVQELDERSIAQRARCSPGCSVDQALGLGGRQRPRQAAGPPR
jgi:hypothetical protein